MTLLACFHSIYFYAMAPLSRDGLNCSFTLKAICKESCSCFFPFSEEPFVFFFMASFLVDLLRY